MCTNQDEVHKSEVDSHPDHCCFINLLYSNSNVADAAARQGGRGVCTTFFQNEPQISARQMPILSRTVTLA